jgi:hypothetical protein
MSESKSGFSSAHLKWIIVGVLGITFMFLFRGELSEMLNKAEKVTIGPEGVSIQTKTIQTPLGETIVSGPPTMETAGIQPGTAPDFQSPRGYAINWPQDGSWSSHPDLATAMNVELVIGYNRSWGDYVPNVNVTIENAGTPSIREWLTMSNPKIELYGFSVISSEVDESNNAGVRVVKGFMFGYEANMIQRIIINQGLAYVATATRPVSLNADPQLWQDLNDILNSFRII